ncbi:MAG TPA: type II secretion system F family protein [Candidatus Ozemobacteraceae bacterium]|nr:type II secretion system F family protein [Candidatus Ozemobacteraceae bacterium]
MSRRRFSYRALDAHGKPMDGVMEAESTEEVGIWLADRQYYVLEISEAPLATLAAAAERTALHISQVEMNYFLMQLSSLLNAGCPLIQSLQALHRQLPPSSLKTLLQEIKEKIESGKSFSDALKAHPGVFSTLFVTMVEMGEVGGILDEVLERYAQIHDSMYRIRSKVIKAMIYPAVLLGVTLLVSWALLVKVFPVFIEQVAAHGQVLPLPTRIVLFLSHLLSDNSLLIFGGIGLLVFVYLRMSRTESGARLLSSLLLGLPVLGTLAQKFQLALFSRTLGTLLKCGVPILTSLSAVEKALTNEVFRLALGEIKAGVARGESVSAGMGKHRDLFPDSLILMADVGERGGNIGAMLEKAGVIYERDLESTIEAAVSLIQPLLVIFLALFVVLLTMAMYLPMFDIIKMVR